MGTCAIGDVANSKCYAPTTEHNLDIFTQATSGYQQSCLQEKSIMQYQAPDSEPSLMPVFLSSTCFRPPGAAQQQSGFLNFTSGSV